MSTLNTKTAQQQLPTQQMSPRTFDPTPLTSEFSTQTIPCNSRQQPVLTIYTIPTNPMSNHTTSSTLSTPPLPTIPNDPLTYRLSSTNIIILQNPFHFPTQNTHNNTSHMN